MIRRLLAAARRWLATPAPENPCPTCGNGPMAGDCTDCNGTGKSE